MAPSLSQSEPRPVRIGLALSGGGTRGAAHVGVIKALLELGVRPDVVAGASAGSIVATMYGAGIAPDDMLGLFRNSRFRDVFAPSFPGAGFFRLEKFKSFFGAHVGYDRLEDLPVPAVVTATDIDRGERVAFDHGVLVDCVAASCSIPVVFRPVVIDGVRYVDGGVLANLPAWALSGRCDYMIGSNCCPLSEPKPVNTMFYLAQRNFEIMWKHNSLPEMALCDAVIQTRSAIDYSMFNFKVLEKIVEGGYADTMAYFEAHPLPEQVKTR